MVLRKGCSYQIIEELYVKRIYTTCGEIDIDFNYLDRTDIAKDTLYNLQIGAERGDVFSALTPKKLREISIQGKTNLSSLDKLITLSHSYFNDGQGISKERLRVR